VARPRGVEQPLIVSRKERGWQMSDPSNVHKANKQIQIWVVESSPADTDLTETAALRNVLQLGRNK
jgi:hypothetical protein